MQKICKNMQNMAHPHFNLQYNDNAKYGEVSYRELRVGPEQNMLFCIFFINIQNMSKNAKWQQEVHMNVANSIHMQPCAYF